MVSREHNREALHDKLQILRSITHSHAMNETSIVLDASNYIKELKHKVERLNEEIATAESSTHQNLWPRVSVETLEKGFLVNVHSGKSCPGLLVSILATFEELGLNVLDARVSCAESFHLQALGGDNEEDEENVNAQMVKRAIASTIKNWSESIGKIWLEIDALSLIPILHNRSPGCWKLQHLISRFLLLTADLEIRITHTHWEGNKAADLANLACSTLSSEEFVWSSTPSSLKGILQVDK